MMIADIIDNKVINIFESEKSPNYPPRVDGSIPFFLDVSNVKNIDIGWTYNPADGSFTEPPEPEPEPEKQITAAEMIEAVLINTEFLMAVNEMEGL